MIGLLRQSGVMNGRENDADTPKDDRIIGLFCADYAIDKNAYVRHSF